MTNEEIQEAAKEAFSWNKTQSMDDLQRFAAIIEKRTIERCAQKCEQTICECCYNVDGVEAANECAAAIRKLGEQ